MKIKIPLKIMVTFTIILFVEHCINNCLNTMMEYKPMKTLALIFHKQYSNSLKWGNIIKREKKIIYI